MQNGSCCWVDRRKGRWNVTWGGARHEQWTQTAMRSGHSLIHLHRSYSQASDRIRNSLTVSLTMNAARGQLTTGCSHACDGRETLVSPMRTEPALLD